MLNLNKLAARVCMSCLSGGRKDDEDAAEERNYHERWKDYNEK